MHFKKLLRLLKDEFAPTIRTVSAAYHVIREMDQMAWATLLLFLRDR